DREPSCRQQRAMGKVDHVQYDVDQRQSERDQRIDGAHQDAVDDRLDQNRRREHALQAGIGKTGLALANVAGKITWISPESTCVLTGAAPWFWPLTNLVGP